DDRASAPAVAHQAGRRLSTEDLRLEVEPEHPVPALLGDIQPLSPAAGNRWITARIVHPDVEPAEGRDSFLSDRAEMSHVGDIAGAHDCAASERLDLRAQLLEVVATPRGQDKVRALRRVGERNGAPESPAGSADH